MMASHFYRALSCGRIIILVALAWGGCARYGWAQGGGVHVDTTGVLRFREEDRASRLKRLKNARARRTNRAGLENGYISLPKLFAEVHALLDAGEEIPEPMRFLNGLVKIRYVFVYPEEHDLVIAGDAEPWDSSGDPHRPVGSRSGRPVLQLDDLVVALRTVGPASRSKSFGCTLDMPSDWSRRMQSAAARLGVVSTGQYDRATESIARAVGYQTVRFFSVDPETRFAFACVEADYIMKRLVLGLMKSPVRGVKSHVSMLRSGDSAYNRFWFTPFYEPLLVSTDGLAFEIRGQALAVRTSDSARGDHHAGSPSAMAFAKMMTERFPELAENIPAFADLWNLADLGVFAALLAEDDLHRKCNWDLSWILADDVYRIPEVPVPTRADTLASHRMIGRRLSVVVGGVTLDMEKVVNREHREADNQRALQRIARRTGEKEWSLRVER